MTRKNKSPVADVETPRASTVELHESKRLAEPSRDHRQPPRHALKPSEYPDPGQLHPLPPRRPSTSEVFFGALRRFIDDPADPVALETLCPFVLGEKIRLGRVPSEDDLHEHLGVPIETGTQLLGLVFRGLTNPPKLREPRRVRERRKPKEDKDLEGLDALAAPKNMAEEMNKLAAILERAKVDEPADRERFVQQVNAALHKNNLALRIDGTQQICLRLKVINGSIMLQPTAGGSSAFKKGDFTIVEYVRPYRRRTTPRKL